ncbi:MAG: thioredoxin [Acidobacteriota bacterium]
MANDKVLTLDDANFDSEINSDTPILVDFWAQWCGPCRMVAPVLDQLAEEMDGKVRIGKVNIDHHQDLAVKFGISSIPAFVLFENGEIKDRMMGAMPKSAFESFLNKNLAQATA